MPASCSSDAMALYGPGMFDASWEKLVVRCADALNGSWELMHPRSDSVDKIMSGLGIGFFKRNMVKGFRSRIVISGVDTGVAHICTHLPMGTRKEGDVPLSGKTFRQFEPDTNVEWANEAALVDGVLCQKRTSALGTMYDVRCVFAEDPEGRCDAKPIKLFRWTFVDTKGNVLVANRWAKKCA